MTDLQRAGKYEILKRIGEGGFGVVYQGRDPFIKRPVAIKTCTSENEETRKRFLREAEISGSIEHPNVTVVYDFGYEENTPYLVQEFLSGEDLDHKVAKREQITLVTKIDYLLQIAQGLGFAHEQGITHRDIKPSNIRVLEDDRVKIMDFGIAKLASGETQLTQTGTTLGTPAYLSPEQLRGDEVDQRSDLYSFGVLAFELITYQRLFDADTISALFFQILHQPARALAEVWPECPPDLSQLISRCVEKDPQKRIQSFHDVVVVLQKILEDVRTSGQDISASAILAPAPEGPPDLERTRQHAMTEARNQIENLLSSGDLKQAARALLEARESFGNAIPFRTLHDRLMQAQTSEIESIETGPELAGALEEVDQLLAVDAFDQADAAVERAVESCGEHPSLVAARRRVKVRRRIAAGRSLIDRGAIEEAEKEIRLAYDLDPDNPDVSLCFRLIEASRSGEEATVISPAAPADDATVMAAPISGDTATVLAPSPTPAAGAPTPAPVSAPSAESAAPVPPPPTVTAPAATAPAATAPVTTPVEAAPDSATPAPAAAAAGAARAGSAPRWQWIAAAAAVVVLGLVIVLFFPRGGPPATASGFVVDASPWAEIVRVVDADGVEIELPRPAYTPLLMPLAAGSYRVTVRHPSLAEERTVELELRAGQPAPVIDLGAATATDYFTELGW